MDAPASCSRVRAGDRDEGQGELRRGWQKGFWEETVELPSSILSCTLTSNQLGTCSLLNASP